LLAARVSIAAYVAEDPADAPAEAPTSLAIFLNASWLAFNLSIAVSTAAALAS